MEFKVNFVAVEGDQNNHYLDKNSDLNSVYIPERVSIGTLLLNKLNLKAEDISNTFVSKYGCEISIPVPQDVAEESKQFFTNNVVEVKASKDYLIDLFKIELENGKLVYKPIAEKFIEFWKDNNYSLLILSEADKLILEQREQARKEKEEQERKKEEEKHQRKLEEEEEKARRETEKIEWIREYGSQYLKDCLDLGVYAHREYLLERAAKEFPGYTLDYNDNAGWNDRYSPSPEAIEELISIRKLTPDSIIVWLTDDGIVRDYDDEPFEPCEAVVVRKFLGKYDLYKLM